MKFRKRCKRELGGSKDISEHSLEMSQYMLFTLKRGGRKVGRQGSLRRGRSPLRTRSKLSSDIYGTCSLFFGFQHRVCFATTYMVLFFHVRCFFIRQQKCKRKCTETLGNVEEQRLFYEDATYQPYQEEGVGWLSRQVPAVCFGAT